MKEAIYHKSFLKALKKLRPREIKRVNDSIELFLENPRARQLRNHALHGKFRGWRSISAGGDLRILFREDSGGETIFFLSVGDHAGLFQE